MEEEYSTGDLLLFRGNTWYSRLIEYFSGSVYSHAGILLRNPRQMEIDLPDGDYVLHSSYGRSEETGEMVYGVHIESLDKVLESYPEGGVDIRKVHARRSVYFYRRLHDIHSTVHNKPYDTNLIDWISAMYRKKLIDTAGWYRNTHRFWCSALVAYIYDELEWVNDVDWTIVSPGELAGSCLRWRIPIESPKLFSYLK